MRGRMQPRQADNSFDPLLAALVDFERPPAADFAIIHLVRVMSLRDLLPRNYFASLVGPAARVEDAYPRRWTRSEGSSVRLAARSKAARASV